MSDILNFQISCLVFQGIRKTIAMIQYLLIDEAVLEVSTDILILQDKKHRLPSRAAESRADLTDSLTNWLID